MSSHLSAAEFYILEPKDVSFEARKYVGEVHEPYLHPDDKGLRYGGVFITDFYLLKDKNSVRALNLFMNNKLHFDQSEINGRVVYAGWNFEIGASVFDKLEIGRGHHSQHCLECVRDVHFPVRDWMFVRFNLLP
jgi:hypothetical protein